MSARVLIVEDEVLLAYDLAEQLEQAGFTVTGIATSLREAIGLSAVCDLAVLDVNLGRGQTSAPVAEQLTREGKRFVVLSGYSVDQMPAIFATATRFAKPVSVLPLIAELKAMAAATG